MSQGFHPMAPPVAYQNPFPAPDHIDLAMAFGVTAVAGMLICRWQQKRAPRLVAGTILFGFMSGAYGFMAGAWPLGVALIIYAVVVTAPYMSPRADASKPSRDCREHRVDYTSRQRESRLNRLFLN